VQRPEPPRKEDEASPVSKSGRLKRYFSFRRGRRDSPGTSSTLKVSKPVQATEPRSGPLLDHAGLPEGRRENTSLLSYSVGARDLENQDN